MQKQKSESRLAVYYELTKPKIWYLLVFTAFGAILMASNIYEIEVSPATWALALFSVAAGSAAANTLTNYHDRDIDAIMERTKNRPLPSKRIFPATKARNFGLGLAGISLVLAFAISFTTTLEQGLWATGFIAFGLVNNVLVYSYVLKRTSRTNIILGRFMWWFSSNDWMGSSYNVRFMDNGSCNGRIGVYLDSNAYLGFNFTF